MQEGREKWQIVPMAGMRDLLIYENLSQAYEAEFSSLTGCMPDHLGRYALQTPLDENHPGFLLMEGDIPLGFMVICLGEIQDVSEFYILPVRRRMGCGFFLAKGVFSLFPGRWQIRQIQGADHAVLYWRGVLDRLIPGGYAQALVEDPFWGFVTRQRFTLPTPTP